MFTRTRCQNGSLKIKERKKGEGSGNSGTTNRMLGASGNAGPPPSEHWTIIRPNRRHGESPALQAILLRINSDPAQAVRVRA